MQSGSLYRFKKVVVERLSLLKGEDSWYSISDAQNEPVVYCHVIGNCLGGTSTFQASRGDPEVLFRMEPRRKVLNMTYFVSEGGSGPRLAVLELFATRGLKVCDTEGREIFRVIDPQSTLDKVMQDVLEGCCTEYAIVDDDRVIGGFGRRASPRPVQEAGTGLLRRLLAGALKLVARDWCIELEEEGKVIDDHRPLLAAMVLLQEQSIRLDQAM